MRLKNDKSHDYVIMPKLSPETSPNVQVICIVTITSACEQYIYCAFDLILLLVIFLALEDSVLLQ